MKYHVNPETGKASPCRAKVRCRFGGESGQENHYTSKVEADRAAEAVLQEKYDTPSTHKKVSPTFKKKCDRLKEGLAATGVSRRLPAVSNERELIEKWFDGDREKYELISRLTHPESDLKQNTKTAVNRLVKNGQSVAFAKDFDHLEKLDSRDESAIDLLDEDFPADFDLGSLNLFGR